jgi:hypothetical protein
MPPSELLPAAKSASAPETETEARAAREPEAGGAARFAVALLGAVALAGAIFAGDSAVLATLTSASGGGASTSSVGGAT